MIHGTQWFRAGAAVLAAALLAGGVSAQDAAKPQEPRPQVEVVFCLVGDAPPDMDFNDDVKYPETCKLAVQRDILINTVQCGTHAETKKYWLDICRLAEGSYVQIDEKGGPVVVVNTPFDADLAKI